MFGMELLKFLLIKFNFVIDGKIVWIEWIVPANRPGIIIKIIYPVGNTGGSTNYY